MREIILASNSPRRKEILKKAGIKFKVKPADCDEIYSPIYDESVVKQNSIKKASVAKNGDKAAIVIAADTVVILDSVCLVKPRNFYEGFFMLKKLSHKTHFVVTSHTVASSSKEVTEISKSLVTFRKLGNIEIIKYLITEKPFDKAGCYGIQDFLTPENCAFPPKESFISKLEGSYYNVMGLDIELVQKILENF